MCNSYERIFDESIKLKDNAMLKFRADLFYEWNFEKNDELGLDIYKITKGSGKLAWWKCPKCKSSYDMKICLRNNQRQNCPYCSGHRVNHTNSLTTLNPELASEWHPTKNGELTPNDVTCNSFKEVWWKCKKYDNHEWKTIIANRNRIKCGCPICDGKQILIGFNNMWTTNHELAKLLADPEDGYKYTQNSNKKVDWKCPECGEIMKNRAINNVIQKGLSCPKCSDGKSYPEKVMYHLLRQLNVEFEWEKTFDWLNNKRYDFYLPDYNMIIEINGGQHYGKGFESIGGRNIKDETNNDKLKEDTAIKNGIEHYIIIDARYSDINYIKTNIINSKINMQFDLSKVNWNEINKSSLKSLVIQTITLWNKGYNVKEISSKLYVHPSSVWRYLNSGKHNKLCNYDAKKEREKTCRINGLKRVKMCIQLTLENQYIKEWESLKKASIELNISYSSISQVCNGKQNHAGGYKWMFKEDYDKLIHNQEVC